MFTALPESSQALVEMPWAEVEPWFDELAGAPLTVSTAPSWLAHWSRLSELLHEALVTLDIACTQDTSDLARAEKKQHYLEAVFGPAESREQQLTERLLDSGIEPQGFGVPLRSLRAEAARFREANLAPLRDEQALTDEYLRISTAQTVAWDGEQVNSVRLRLALMDPDRRRREAAWHLLTRRQLEDRTALETLWRRGLRLRQSIAREAGYDSYRAYRWDQLFRFDYSPDDCRRFHAAVEEVVVPASRRIWAARRHRLGVESIRPWDMHADPEGAAAPRSLSDIGDVLARCTAAFRLIDPRLRDQFALMVREGLCDLEDRPFKATIGYHQALEARKRPFIFGQVYTVQDVVSTVFHEAGHAFHAFEMAPLPYCWQRRDTFLPLEFAEVASTTMELLGSMYLHRSGLCTPAEEAAVRAQHLDRFVTQLFPLTARGDAFQQWVYDDVERASDLDACDQCWIDLSARFLPDLDWRGMEAEQRAEWLQVRHFFGWPFYYIEYALAALGAWQIVANYLTDPGHAVDRFRSALALGATRSIPDLFAEAGTVFGFDASLMARVLDVINRMKAGLQIEH